jgi:hypothetical protein
MIWWLLPAALAVHMLEEIIWLPAWSQSAGGWHPPVGRREFTFASMLVVGLGLLAAFAAEWSGPGGWGAYLATGLAAVMVVNFFVPHAGAALQLRRYAPGLASSALLMVPASLYLIQRALALDYVSPLPFIAMAIGTPVIAAYLWPKLFVLGRRLVGRP